MIMLRSAMISVVLLGLSSAAHAGPMGYEIHWNGANSFNLRGHFTFDRSEGQTLVLPSSLDSFELTGVHMGRTLFSFDGTPSLFMYRIGEGTFNLLGQYGLPVSVRPMQMPGPAAANVSLAEPTSLALLFAAAAAAAFGIRRRVKA